MHYASPPKINFRNGSRVSGCCTFPGPRHPPPPPQFEIPGEIRKLSCPREEGLKDPNNAPLSQTFPEVWLSLCPLPSVFGPRAPADRSHLPAAPAAHAVWTRGAV